jgi:23S rRNA A2030 N6-methylase RlmJ
MANRHFGNLGDVWKHLPLAAILDRERPARYWESHAGSALYPLTPSPGRDFGVNTFLAKAPASPLLRDSIYTRLLATLRGRYPGSPQIALRILGEVTFYRFCDLDETSLKDIRASAMQLGFPPGGVQVARADGLATLSAAGRALSGAEARATLALLDPFRPLERSATGLHALGLFEQLARQGVRTVLWYGYKTAAEEEAWWIAVQPSLKVVDEVWFGQIDLVDERAARTAGLLGCGILCANLSPQTAAYCATLGNALAAVYADVRLPGDISGALNFKSSF